MVRHPLLASLLSLAAVGFLAIYLGGCDVARIDEGANTPLEEHLSALEEADTQQEAVSAIRGILNRAGVGLHRADEDPNGTYGDYALTHEQVETLADQVVRYNRGDQDVRRTVAEAYERAVFASERLSAMTSDAYYATGAQHPTIRASLEEVVQGFEMLAHQAADEPEADDHALLFAIAADGTTLPGAEVSLPTDKVLSPVQYVLFSVWLHKYGPLMPVYEVGEEAGKTGNPNVYCPAPEGLVAKFQVDEGTESYNEEYPDDGTNPVDILAGDLDGATWGTDGTLIGRVIVKAGTKSDVIFYYNGSTGDSFDNSDLYGKDISNVRFCGYDKQFAHNPCCYWKAVVAYLFCEWCGDPNSDCDEIFNQVYSACHDQGESSGY